MRDYTISSMLKDGFTERYAKLFIKKKQFEFGNGVTAEMKKRE